MEEIGGILGGIASHVGQTLKSEAKKMAKSAVGHVTGMGASGAGQNSQQGPRAMEEARKNQAQRHYSFTPKQELKSIAQLVGQQITGRLPTPIEISEMNDRDQNLSKADYEAVHQKVLSIYREHERRRKEAAKKLEQQKAFEEEQKKKSQEEMRWKIGVRGPDNPHPAVAKTRAEVGKNFGAE